MTSTNSVATLGLDVGVLRLATWTGFLNVWFDTAQLLFAVQQWGRKAPRMAVPGAGATSHRRRRWLGRAGHPVSRRAGIAELVHAGNDGPVLPMPGC